MTEVGKIKNASHYCEDQIKTYVKSFSWTRLIVFFSFLFYACKIFCKCLKGMKAIEFTFLPLPVIFHQDS